MFTLETKIENEIKTQIAKYSGIDTSKLVGDELDISKSPEHEFWVRHESCSVVVNLTKDRKSGKTVMAVEYPSHKDGEAIRIECQTMEELGRVFGFAVGMLLDIIEQLGEVG